MLLSLFSCRIPGRMSLASLLRGASAARAGSPLASVFSTQQRFAKPGIKKKSAEEAGDAESAEGQFDGAQKKKIKSWIEQIVMAKVPEDKRTPEQKETEAKFVAAVEARLRAREARQAFLEDRKIRVKQNAISALPLELRTRALADDTAPWPTSLLIPSQGPPTKDWLMGHYRLTAASQREE